MIDKTIFYDSKRTLHCITVHAPLKQNSQAGGLGSRLAVVQQTDMRHAQLRHAHALAAPDAYTSYVRTNCEYRCRAAFLQRAVR
jgi:hypothetical protein